MFLFQDGISGQSTPQSYYMPCLLTRQYPGLASQLVRGKNVLWTHKGALRSHERAPSKFNINISAAFFKFCVKTLVIGLASQRCAAPAAPHSGHQGAPVPFHRPLGLTDRGNKDGDLNKRLKNATLKFYSEQHACKNS